MPGLSLAATPARTAAANSGSQCRLGGRREYGHGADRGREAANRLSGVERSVRAVPSQVLEQKSGDRETVAAAYEGKQCSV